MQVSLSPQKPPPALERRFNVNVKGARGLFALMLFLSHISTSGLPTFRFLETSLAALLIMPLQFGVEIFFCISGFVIAGTIRRSRSPGQFLGERLLRLLPAFWATMPVILALEYAARAPVLIGLSPLQFVLSLAGNLFCLPPIIPIPLFHYAAWSLSYEVVFYVICAVTWSLRPSKAALLIMLPLAAIPICCFPRGLFFLAGLMVAEGVTDRLDGGRRLAGYPAFFLLIFVLAWGGVWQLNGGRMDGGAWNWWNSFRMPLTVVAFLGALMFFRGLVDGAGVFGPLLRSRALQWFGMISYSFYLWQIIVLAVIKRAMYQTGFVTHAGTWSQAAFLMLALPTLLLISWLSHKVLERGLTARLRRWFSNRTERLDAKRFAGQGPVVAEHSVTVRVLDQY